MNAYDELRRATTTYDLRPTTQDDSSRRIDYSIIPMFILDRWTRVFDTRLPEEVS